MYIIKIPFKTNLLKGKRTPKHPTITPPPAPDRLYPETPTLPSVKAGIPAPASGGCLHRDLLQSMAYDDLPDSPEYKRLITSGW